LKTRNNLDTYVIKLDSGFSDGILKAPENRLRIVARLLTLGLVLSLCAALQATHAQETPWKRRLRKGVVLNDSTGAPRDPPRGPLTADEMRRLALRPRGAGLVDLSQWPTEPPSPARVAPTELARALAQICPASIERADLDRYAEAIIRYSSEFSVDPWLVAALVYTQSECVTGIDNTYGTGLTLINYGMHASNIRAGVYHFGAWTRDGWSRSELDVSAFPFRRETLAKSEPNLYFAAALLYVFNQQCPQIDRSFDSVPHRHPVSHFIWGDHVGDTGPEDRILTARRRLLNSHARTRNGGDGIGDIAFVSPLDGYPRVATSGLGEPRDHGRRPHRGIDLASEYGEPVRSVAAGTVVFAGVDWERRAHIPLEPWGAKLVHGRHMGPRGLFVEVDHGNGVVSLYSHLASYDVKVGDRVEAGQRVGEVGRTGIRDSGAHLHFGLFHRGKVLDPLDHLAAYVFPPALTKRGRAELSRAKKPHAVTSARARRRRGGR
jgi:murein DD-endopeptidase MepM/ murein hydrolase activator NlpD